MVITHNQNKHFRSHKKNSRNMNPNYNIIPCFVEKNPKKHLKYMLYQNKVCGFLLQVPTVLPTFL
jgi:hypothetical protein